MKQSAYDNFEFVENSRKFSKQVENTVGKGEIARYEQFLLFPQCFQKACFPRVSKGVIVWEWVNPLPDMPILGSSNSAANKNVVSKEWTNGDTVISRVENIVGKGEIARYEQFFFSVNVFKSCLLLMCQNEYLWSKGLN